MKKISLVVIAALMAFAMNVFAQDAAKPATQEKAKTAEVKPAEEKAAVKTDAKVSKKHHGRGKKASKKDAAVPEKK